MSMYNNNTKYRYIYKDGKKYFNIYKNGKKYFDHRLVKLEDHIQSIFLYPNINFILPLTLKTFFNIGDDIDGYYLTWEVFNQTPSFLIPQWDGAEDYYFDCIKDFKGEVFINMITYTNLNYYIYENGILIYSTFGNTEQFTNTTKIYFKTGKYYEFVIYYIDAALPYYAIDDLSFSIDYTSYDTPTDLSDISRSINYFKDQQLFLPIASQSFVDSYSHTINWEVFRYDTSKLQPNYGESTNYHSVICQQSFTADVKVSFDKEDDNGNPYQVSYFIFENEMEMKRIDQISSFNKFDWTERINFVAGNYYTFRVYGTPSVGGGYLIKNLTFSINEI